MRMRVCARACVQIAGRMREGGVGYYDIQTPEGRKHRADLNACIHEAFRPEGFTAHACVHSVDWDCADAEGIMAGSVKRCPSVEQQEQQQHGSMEFGLDAVEPQYSAGSDDWYADLDDDMAEDAAA